MEVGKKYTRNSSSIYEAVFKHPTGEVVVVYLHQDGHPISQTIGPQYFNEYKEYIPPPEPIVHVQYITWLKNRVTREVHVVSSSFPNATYHSAFDVLHRETITFTEHPKCDCLNKECKHK